MNITFEEYKEQVLEEFKKLNATPTDYNLATDDVLETGLKNNRKPQDLAWALIQWGEGGEIMKNSENFDEQNIKNIRKQNNKPLGDNGKVWVLKEIKLKPCKVNISEKSRKICAEALLK